MKQLFSMVGVLAGVINFEIEVTQGCYDYREPQKVYPDAREDPRFSSPRTKLLRWIMLLTSICAVCLHIVRFVYKMKWANKYKRVRNIKLFGAYDEE